MKHEVGNCIYFLYIILKQNLESNNSICDLVDYVLKNIMRNETSVNKKYIALKMETTKKIVIIIHL